MLLCPLFSHFLGIYTCISSPGINYIRMKSKLKERMKNLTRKSLESRVRRREEREGSRGCEAEPVPSTSTQSPTRAHVPPLNTTRPDKKVFCRSREKFDANKHLDISGNDQSENREYLLVDLDNMLQWVREIARCKCGAKMKVHEIKAIGMARYFEAKCNNCDRKVEMCTSRGGNRKSSENKPSENRPYDVHQKLVASSLQSSSGYQGVTNLCASFDMHPMSDTTYYKLAPL